MVTTQDETSEPSNLPKAETNKPSTVVSHLKVHAAKGETKWLHIVTDAVHLFSNSLILRKKLSKKHTTHVSRIEICRRTRKTRF